MRTFNFISSTSKIKDKIVNRFNLKLLLSHNLINFLSPMKIFKFEKFIFFGDGFLSVRKLNFIIDLLQGEKNDDTNYRRENLINKSEITINSYES